MILLAGGGSQFEVGFSIPASTVVPLGGVGLSLGLGIIAAGFLLHEVEAYRRSAGMAIVILAALSTLSGGGFIVGLALAVLGGCLAMFLQPIPLYRPSTSWHG